MMEERKILWPTPGNTITTKFGMRYVIGQPISSGGYALVFEGIDSFGNSIALKVYKPASRPFEEVQSQWQQECRMFEKLRHPNVVAIYGAFVCNNLFYIVLERAWGNLYDWIQKVKPITKVVVKEMARQLLFAIHFIHSHGVVHRDITIYNTLVFEGPRSRGAIFKISDFGISKEFLDPWEPKICKTYAAHPRFIPPELLLPQYGYTNEQSNLYHLGLILLYSLTGNLPLNEAMSNKEIERAIKDGIPRQEAERIRTPLGDFIAVLLRRRHEYRFRTAIKVWNALKPI